MPEHFCSVLTPITSAAAETSDSNHHGADHRGSPSNTQPGALAAGDAHSELIEHSDNAFNGDTAADEPANRNYDDGDIDDQFCNVEPGEAGSYHRHKLNQLRPIGVAKLRPKPAGHPR